MRLTMRCCKKQMKGADNKRLKNKIHSPTDLTYGTPSWNEVLSVA